MYTNQNHQKIKWKHEIKKKKNAEKNSTKNYNIKLHAFISTFENITNFYNVSVCTYKEWLYNIMYMHFAKKKNVKKINKNNNKFI